MDKKIEEMAMIALKNTISYTCAKQIAMNFYNAGYRKESDTARECLEQFICRLVNARLVGVNDDLYYELLEAKDDLVKEKYEVNNG